jgi:antitoxin ParD1/3/4
MTSIQIVLAETTKNYIDGLVSSGRFSSPSEYLGFLVEQARTVESKRKLDDLLEEGLNSGAPIPFSTEWWQTRKAELLATLPPDDQGR